MMDIRAWTYYNSKHDFDEGDFDDMLFKNESSEAGVTEPVFICDQSLLDNYTRKQAPPLREAETTVAV